jgi:hypothetical protein
MDVAVGNGCDVLKPFKQLPDGSEVWVHNLPYDAEFLYWELCRAGYRLVYDIDVRDKHSGVFTMLCDLQGVVTMTIYTDGRAVTLRDSNRIFRCKLEKLPKLCGFESDITKGTMDYEALRPRDHVKTPEELDYQVRDVQVLMKAMKWVRSYCSEGNTIGSIAVHEFKAFHKRSPFTPLTLEQRQAWRSLYSGGIVFLPETRAGELFYGHGNVYDRNSMYPAEMVKPLPVAVAEHTKGQPVGSGCWALHVQAEGLRLRRNGFPLLITPFTGRGREVIETVDRWLYAEEWAAICEEYDIKRAHVISSIRFEVEPIADEFVEKWYKVKSTEPARRSYAKYVLTNLSGKWGENPIHEQVRRRSERSGNYVTYRYNEIDEEPNKWAFMPAVARVTSNSRLCLRDAAIKSGRENLLYTDTDSVHTTGTLPDNMVDDVKLGAWKCENTFDVARYVKPKSYFEALNGATVSCKHAGINNDATLALWDERSGKWIDTGETINALNMRAGAYFFTRQSRKIEGGIVIERKPKIM